MMRIFPSVVGWHVINILQSGSLVLRVMTALQYLFLKYAAQGSLKDLFIFAEPGRVRLIINGLTPGSSAASCKGDPMLRLDSTYH